MSQQRRDPREKPEDEKKQPKPEEEPKARPHRPLRPVLSRRRRPPR